MTFLYAIGFAVAIAVAIGWIVLPFAVIGTKPILNEVLAELRQMNQLLRHYQGK